MMTRIITLMALLASSISVMAQADIVGEWKTIDDNTGETRSVVKIERIGDAYFGRVVKLFLEPEEDPNPVCDDCDEDDDRYNKPVLGLEIIRDMKQEGDEYSDGNILDPENGSVYRCSMWLENGDLKVRGYLAFFYRTQTWKRLK